MLGEALGLIRISDSRLIHASHAAISIGGAEMNVAIALARLGARAAWLGRVGDDGFGQRIQRELMAEGVETHGIVDPSHPTGVMVKEPQGQGRTNVTFLRGRSAGSRLQEADVTILRIEQRDHLHITGIPLALWHSSANALRAAVTIARAHGVPVSFDVNHRPSLWHGYQASPVYRELARSAQTVFGDRSELELLVGDGKNDKELARAVRELGPREVVVKRGERGAAAWDGQRWYDEPAVKVPVVDTVGAGDAFVAGYLWARLDGGDIPAALRAAAWNGAAVCTHAGDWEGAPFATEMGVGDGGDPVRR